MAKTSWNSISDPVLYQILEQTRAGVWNQIWKPDVSRVWDQPWIRSWGQIRAHVGDAIWGQTWGPLGLQILEQGTEDINA